MSFDRLLGNEQLKQDLSAARQKGKLAHFYLISGPEGSGRHTLARLLAAGIYPDAWNTCGELLYTNTLAASEGIWLHTAPVPLLWGLLLCSSLFEPAARLRPSRRQRCIAIGVSAAAILCALAARLVWAQAIPTALTVLCFAPVLLWALTSLLLTA